MYTTIRPIQDFATLRARYDYLVKKYSRGRQSFVLVSSHYEVPERDDFDRYELNDNALEK